MPSPAESSGGHEQSLEQQIIDLFLTTRKTREEFFGADSAPEEAGLKAKLDEALAQLSEDEILSLNQPPDSRGEIEYSSAAINTIQASQHLAELQRQGDLKLKLWKEYFKRQNFKAYQLLQNKKITVTAIQDETKRYAHPIRGILQREDSLEVSGRFRQAYADGALVLGEESDDPDAKMWHIRIFDVEDSLLVNLRIEN